MALLDPGSADVAVLAASRTGTGVPPTDGNQLARAYAVEQCSLSSIAIRVAISLR